ncbi:MAG TPA: hypothetical protein VFE05_02000 [Longimicrobiaceae bacterium]|nr:hypothetical protein [Longimicrobiaceae bacterium]
MCSRNRLRSLTAEHVFADVPGWQVRSAGTEPNARIRVTAGHVGWADVVVVMEKRHRERMRQRLGDALNGKRFVCLHVSDDYAYMDPLLVRLLRERLAEHVPIPGDATEDDEPPSPA